MDLTSLPTCEKQSLVERLNEEIQAQREKVLASLSADELAVYRVMVAVQLMNKWHGESGVAPKRSRSPEMKALRSRVARTIEQAVSRVEELDRDGLVPGIVDRLEGLGLLPY